MKSKHYIMLMAMPLMTVACQKQQQSTGLNAADMDTTVAAGTDFYQYACGGWMAANPLKAEYSRYGSFDRLTENTTEQLQGLILDIASRQNPEGSDAEKIAAMYNSAMDSVSLNKQGIYPIEEELRRIKACTERDQLFRLYANMQVDGVGGLFGLYIDADIKDSKNNLVHIYSSGLLMGEKEYYIDTDSATTAIRDAYKAYMTDRFLRCAVAADSTAAEAQANAVFELEHRLAQATRSAAEMRDPERNYNRMSLDSLCNAFSGIDWKVYFAQQGMREIKAVSVGQPETLHEVEAIWNETPVGVLQDYISWQLINAASSYLNDEMRAADFAFYGKVMSGKEEDRPRWKRAVASVESALGEAVGKLYAEKYFPAEAKERMVQLVRNLQIALGERIDAQEWMSDSTKAVAHDKLNAFIVKVGYPDKWKDYSAMELGRNYWENIKAARRWAHYDMINRKLNKPVDNTEWYMYPQTVNAYYNPTTNEICFPAGILQPPFFDMQADDAFNYGAIGVVIGHEMTHGFDDQGAKYDKDGNLRQWWTAEDTQRFEERTHVMRDFFNSIVVLPASGADPELHGNGQLTLGENMADHGGLMVAFQAFKNATKDHPLETRDGFTPEQRFFLAYAGVWAGNIRDEEIRRRTKSDPHALGRWRVNGALPHIDAWYEAFGITEQDPMFVPKEQRVSIW